MDSCKGKRAVIPPWSVEFTVDSGQLRERQDHLAVATLGVAAPKQIGATPDETRKSGVDHGSKRWV